MIILRVRVCPQPNESLSPCPARWFARSTARVEKNRSRFVLRAVKRELERRRRAELRRSLQSPHAESEEFTESGFDEWARSLPEQDACTLVDPSSGTAVSWVQGQGWLETDE